MLEKLEENKEYITRDGEKAFVYKLQVNDYHRKYGASGVAYAKVTNNRTGRLTEHVFWIDGPNVGLCDITNRRGYEIVGSWQPIFSPEQMDLFP